MSQANIKPPGESKADKQRYELQLKEKELREREKRLQEHRQYLNDQMLIRQDYYSLGLFHKMIILVLFITLSAFVTFLVLSYFPPTKGMVHEIIQKIL